jgi:hypothetical protein
MLTSECVCSSTPSASLRRPGRAISPLAPSVLLLLLGYTPIPSVADRPETSFDIAIYGGSSCPCGHSLRVRTVR